MPHLPWFAWDGTRPARAEAVIGSGTIRWRLFHYSTPPVAKTLEIVFQRFTYCVSLFGQIYREKRSLERYSKKSLL